MVLHNNHLAQQDPLVLLDQPANPELPVTPEEPANPVDPDNLHPAQPKKPNAFPAHLDLPDHPDQMDNPVDPEMMETQDNPDKVVDKDLLAHLDLQVTPVLPVTMVNPVTLVALDKMAPVELDALDPKDHPANPELPEIPAALDNPEDPVNPVTKDLPAPLANLVDPDNPVVTDTQVAKDIPALMLPTVLVLHEALLLLLLLSMVDQPLKDTADAASKYFKSKFFKL